MTKNKLNTGDLWFNPNEPEKSIWALNIWAVNLKMKKLASI